MRLPRSRRKRRKTGGAINLGGRGWSAPDASHRHQIARQTSLNSTSAAGSQPTISNRGTTLSDHKPAVGAAIEATFAQLYAGIAVASVKLLTQPSAEITMSGGVRPTIGNVDFDLGATYFLYPGEITGGGTKRIDYWEAAIRADKQISESIPMAGGFAYSPNISNTGAWVDMRPPGWGSSYPATCFPRRLSVPAYLNWQTGVTFTRKHFNLDLRSGDWFPNPHLSQNFGSR